MSWRILDPGIVAALYAELGSVAKVARALHVAPRRVRRAIGDAGVPVFGSPAIVSQRVTARRRRVAERFAALGSAVAVARAESLPIDTATRDVRALGLSRRGPRRPASVLPDANDVSWAA